MTPRVVAKSGMESTLLRSPASDRADADAGEGDADRAGPWRAPTRRRGSG